MASTSAQSQHQNPWPMSLSGTAHVRPCVVIARDPQADTFAVRAAAGGPVTDLTKSEAFLFEQIRTNGVQVVLQSKFGSASGIQSIETTMALTLRLHENGLLEPLSNQDLMKSLEMLASRHQHRAPSITTRSTPGNTQGSTANHSMGLARIAGHPAVSLLILISVFAVFTNPVTRSNLSVDSVIRFLETPAIALAGLWFCLLIASTLYGLCAHAVTQGALPPSLQSPSSLKFQWRGVFFLLAEFETTPIDMLTRMEEIRVRATLLILPWLAAGCVAMLVNSTSEVGTGTMLSALAIAFALVGLRETSPLERRQLVALLEAYSNRTDLLESTGHFLRKGLFRFDQKSAAGEGILASTMIAWLAGLTIYGSEILISSVYGLGNQVAALAADTGAAAHVTNAIASAAWLLMLATIAIGGAARLISIPFENAFSLAAIPIKALRPKALLALNKNLTPQALQQALNNLPIFADLPDTVILRAIQISKIQQTSAGEVIINQGESGRDFYVILEGNFLVEGSDESQKVIVSEKLIAGDSFGEMALIQNRPRAATVKSTSRGLLIKIPQEGFDSLFPNKSGARENLTMIVRAVKLLQETEALSYLTPAQTLGIARAMQPRVAKAGDVLIREGDSKADCAILIESGSVNVTLRGRTLAENLTRGNLLGTTALMNDSARTATVVCASDTIYLEISRADFLSACSSNAVIAILLGTRTQTQIKANTVVVTEHANELTQSKRMAS